MKGKKITFSLLYYNDEQNIRPHLKEWETYNDLVKFQIIDDGSLIPAKKILKDTIFSELDSTLYRIEDDIPWNIPGARNLSAAVCDTELMLICDMDQVFDRRAVQEMNALEGKAGIFYSFRRKNNRKTCGTMLVSIKDWWKAGGYDEDMAGSYGHNDPLFRRQLRNAKARELTPEIYCEQLSADCALDRRSNNKEKYHKKIKNLPRENWNCLRFNWKQENI